jgi:3-phenylpropionate/trans-cinnamate dioxygenase ferredoxin subunit
MSARAPVWRDVGSESELRNAGRLTARVDGREIGVVVGGGGEPRAFRNRCPHHGAPLCDGVVRPRLTGGPGSYALAGSSVLHCPWHGWQFDVETGRCPEDARMRVAVYEARIAAGRVQIRA